MISLHIGVHKTGSTSLQWFLGAHREPLSKAGFRFPEGLVKPNNHVEIYLACLRDGRDSMALLSARREQYLNAAERARNEVLDWVAQAHDRGESLILSTEGLSLLRFPDELIRLHRMLGDGRVPVRVVCVLRNPADYLASYRAQIESGRGRRPSSDPASALYVEPDSWLADFPAMLSVWRAQFGSRAVTLVDYDAEVAANGDVLPATLRALGIPAQMVPEPGAAPMQNVTRTGGLLSRLLGRRGGRRQGG